MPDEFAKTSTSGHQANNGANGNWKLQKVIPSRSDCARPLLEEVLEQLQQREWPTSDVFGVHLALEEAFVNAIKHGNRHDENKNVHFRCELSGDLLRIEIVDEGDGFDPRRVPDPTEDDNLECPCGRGLMLMKNFMSKIEYNDRGNHVTMHKSRGDGSEDLDD